MSLSSKLGENMKINSIKFCEFLKLLAIKGDIENKELIFNVNENNIEVLTISPLKTVSVFGNFRVSETEKMQLGIGNMKLLYDFISLFDEETIEMTKNRNELVMKDSDKRNSLSYILTEPQYILNSLDLKKFNEIQKKASGNEFTLTFEAIQKIIKCFRTVNNGDLILSNNGNDLTVALEHNSNKILSTIKSNIKGDFSVRVSGLLVDILASVGNEIQISIKNDCPISILIKNDDYEVNYLLALMKK